MMTFQIPKGVLNFVWVKVPKSIDEAASEKIAERLPLRLGKACHLLTDYWVIYVDFLMRHV